MSSWCVISSIAGDSVGEFVGKYVLKSGKISKTADSASALNSTGIAFASFS